MEYWDGFDTSHWKTSDKAWMAERKQQWLEIEKLLYVLDKNKKARSIIKQNLVISLGAITCMAVASLFGIVPLTMGVIAHEGSTVVVCLNSLRLLFGRG